MLGYHIQRAQHTCDVIKTPVCVSTKNLASMIQLYNTMLRVQQQQNKILGKCENAFFRFISESSRQKMNFMKSLKHAWSALQEFQTLKYQ